MHDELDPTCAPVCLRPPPPHWKQALRAHPRRLGALALFWPWLWPTSLPAYQVCSMGWLHSCMAAWRHGRHQGRQQGTLVRLLVCFGLTPLLWWTILCFDIIYQVRLLPIQCITLRIFSRSPAHPRWDPGMRPPISSRCAHPLQREKSPSIHAMSQKEKDIINLLPKYMVGRFSRRVRSLHARHTYLGTYAGQGPDRITLLSSDFSIMR